MSNHTLYWTRADLRWHDNPAFAASYEAASAAGAVVHVLYIDCPAQWQAHGYGQARMALEQTSVQHMLQSATKPNTGATNLHMHVLTSDDFAGVPSLLLKFCQQHGIAALYANRQYEINEVTRDRAVHTLLKNNHIPCHWFEDQCLLPPKQVLNLQAEPYRVFTAYKKNVLAALAQQAHDPLPTPCAQPAHTLEQQALDALAQFVHSQQATHYQRDRDFPGVEGTSKLAAFMAVGLLTTRQCVQAWCNAGHALESVWVSELIWRDYYRYVMSHYPHVGQGKNFKSFNQPIAWANNPAHFTAWCNGQTGYPLVDAAMRCLNSTGFMHNRLRMVVAMFLCKHLRIDWRWGERYFLQQLQDADYCSNNGGWQWCAGTGVDAAPYFRIFNPTTQSQKFDGEGEFIRQWLPELAHLPNTVIHTPSNHVLRPANYPAPIIEHVAARQACLAMYKQANGTVV